MVWLLSTDQIEKNEKVHYMHSLLYDVNAIIAFPLKNGTCLKDRIHWNIQ